jgi:single stranded DNA-binding protein
MNDLHISGNVAYDSELKTTSSGGFLKFTIMHNRKKKVNNQWVDDTPFVVNCVMWTGNHELNAKKLKKGVSVVISGRIAPNKYTQKDGTAIDSFVVNVTSFEMLHSRVTGEVMSKLDINKTSTVSQATDFDDDIPF